MPEPYSEPAGFHRHKCDGCGYVWEHEDSSIKSRTDAEKTKEHKCPACGEECRGFFGYEIYEGPSPPDVTTRK